MFHQTSIDQTRQHFIRQLLAEGAVLLDVRTHCEHAGYHVPGAVNIPYDDIEMLKDIVLSWGKPVVTFSTYGRRSGIAAAKLQSLGIDVFDAGSMFQVEKALNDAQKDLPFAI